jgi:hypothetical protein
VITGTNLSGNEGYYTGPNGTGTKYLTEIINYADYPSKKFINTFTMISKFRL